MKRVGRMLGSCGKFVVARRDPATLFDFVEEPLNPIASAIVRRPKTNWLAAIAFGRDVGPCAFLHGKFSDPIGVIAPVGEQHRPRLQARKKLSGKPIIVSFPRR